MIDCHCNAARKYEDFIWTHRWLISRYINERLEKGYKDAKWDKEHLSVKEKIDESV